MKGFEINTGDRTFSVSAEILVISLDLFHDGRTAFRISGASPTRFEHYTYDVEDMYAGDTVTIKVSDTEQSISPLTIQKKDRNDLLNEYRSLKQELEEAKTV
jgi:hypothetical protein